MLEAAEQLSASGQRAGYPSPIGFWVGEPSREVGVIAPNLAIQLRIGDQTEDRTHFSALWITGD